MIERAIYYGNVLNEKSGVVHAIITTMHRHPAVVSHISQCGLFNPGRNYPTVAMIQKQVESNSLASVTCKLCRRGMTADDSLFSRPKISFK
jgi:hypothetical protein